MVEQKKVTLDRGAAPRAGMFRALSHRNYRIFWVGAFLSNVGTWMQAVAQGWLVLQLTDSSFWLGLDAFMATAPGFFLTLAGGVFADLVDRRRLLLLTQVVAGLAAISLATLIWLDLINVWLVLAFSVLTGSCMAMAGPSYQAMTFDLVGRQDLANAVALNSAQFQLSRVVGPMLAGLGLQYFDLVGCFFLNGLSFVAVVVALQLVRFNTKPKNAANPGKHQRDFWHDLRAGVRYVRRRPRVLSLLVIAAVTSLFGAPYITLIPIFARDIFQLGPRGLAWMMGVAGAGAFCGALVLTYLGDFKKKGWFVLGGALGFGFFLIAFSFATSLRWSLTFLFGVGFMIVTSVAVINTLLHKLVTDEMRGRVMSMFILSFVGTMPIGNLIAGAVAERFGAPWTLAGGGACIVLFVLVVGLTNHRLRQLY